MFTRVVPVPETVEWECVDCDDLELAKRYSGEAGTPGREEYDRIEAPDECPACGGEVQEVATDGGTIVGDPTHPAETASPHTDGDAR